MDLRARFYALWERLGARGDPETVFDDLIARYREPHRRYHNETHLEFGLSQFDLLADTALHPDWVEFAFDYHDSAYVIGATDNEEQSAGLAVGTLKNARVPGHMQSLVDHLTSTVAVRPVQPTECTLVSGGSPTLHFDLRPLREELGNQPVRGEAARRAVHALAGRILAFGHKAVTLQNADSPADLRHLGVQRDGQMFETVLTVGNEPETLQKAIVQRRRGIPGCQAFNPLVER